MAVVPYLACMMAVSRLYALPPRVLPSIQKVEAGVPGTISRNRNGTADLGVMQINTRWLPHLAASWRLGHDDVARRLIAEPCFNIASAGAIMRIYLNEARGDVVQAVGFYHSHTPERASAYQIKVIRAASKLFGPSQKPPEVRPKGVPVRSAPAR